MNPLQKIGLTLGDLMANRRSASSVKRPRPPGPEGFGDRLAALRRTKGLTQRDLAAKLGISQRMVAYYETHAHRPPVHLLEMLRTILGASTDEVLGLASSDVDHSAISARLGKRLQQIEQLPIADKKAILHLLDGMLSRLEPNKSGHPR